MTFDQTTWSSYDEPELVVDLVAGRERRAVPAAARRRARRAVGAVRGRRAADRRAVRRPADRGRARDPDGHPAHAARCRSRRTRPGPSSSPTTPSWFGTVQVPASASALLELRLGQSGHDAMGFAVHVPHYLAQSSFPQASHRGAARTSSARRAWTCRSGRSTAAADEAMPRSSVRSTGSEDVAARGARARGAVRRVHPQHRPHEPARRVRPTCRRPTSSAPSSSASWPQQGDDGPAI